MTTAAGAFIAVPMLSFAAAAPAAAQTNLREDDMEGAIEAKPPGASTPRAHRHAVRLVRRRHRDLDHRHPQPGRRGRSVRYEARSQIRLQAQAARDDEGRDDHHRISQVVFELKDKLKQGTYKVKLTGTPSTAGRSAPPAGPGSDAQANPISTASLITPSPSSARAAGRAAVASSSASAARPAARAAQARWRATRTR